MQTNAANATLVSVHRLRVGSNPSPIGHVGQATIPQAVIESNRFEVAWSKVEAQLRALNVLVPNPKMDSLQPKV